MNSTYGTCHGTGDFAKYTTITTLLFSNIINVSLFHFIRTPFPFYLINLGLFYFNCLFLFYFVSQVSKNLLLGALASVLFCLHPMSAEIVQHITLNNILLETSLMQLGLIFLYQYLEENNYILYIGSNVLLALALICNEISLLYFVFLPSVIS